MEDELAALRAVVAEQVAMSITERANPGSRAVVARRVRELIEVEQAGDPTLLRAAVMELSLAAAEWCVLLDAQATPALHMSRSGR